MSATRLEVACYGPTKAVLSTGLNAATRARYWIAEVYYERQRAAATQLVTIVGSDGAQPSFETLAQTDGIRHCLWLDHSCIELPPASWMALKAWADDVMQDAPSRTSEALPA
ncbi:hypothetical protein [Xanthomonas melonis]|uniref:Uncharacterized protein n=1 Tax=Xanthomonas melonis TaxID=56456 RepID=A0A2S7DEN4_9XANT|nr:hypothetical protein [Xanthomonas melonis]MCC4600280.1 hypothetical protein [Xanthomonas melonis]PPU72272.1 hypothetical protein XmelCFBP4644_12400 [Xanthomonas melonis]